jgi:CubicO group peptidase (beta-lactamase class C family)
MRDTFTLYLRIFRDADGALIGAFRNPEMNFRAGAAQFHVTQMRGTVSFTADPAHPDKALSAIYDAKDATLQIRFPGLDQTFVLKHATPAQASGFFPRPPGSPPYVYRAPQSVDDGWAVARARDVGFDEAKLASLVQSIIDVDPAAKRPDLIDALLIARHGKLVLDEYFEGNDRDRQHDLRSAGKTFSSVMLGALMHEGAAISPDTHLYPLLAGMGPFSNPDPRKDQITLGQLMTHTSGLACDDNDDASPGNEDTLQSQRKERNWWKYTLDLPMAHDPGTRYAYCSAGMNLMGAALTAAAQESLPELFDRTVARPLAWGPYYWNAMPNGQGYLGGGSFVRPRDLLKLGQAYLDGGVWNGHRIVDASWVTRSTKSYVAIQPSTTGLSPDQFQNFYVPAEDGYAWHLAVLHAPGRDYRAYGASGNGGQLLIVVPELDLTVVFTGSNYQQGLIWNPWRDRIIPTEIIPAISDLAVR